MTTRTNRARAGRARATKSLIGLTLVGGTVAAALAVPLGAPSQAASTMPADGIVCTAPTTSAADQAGFVLTAKEGVIQMPDGNTVHMWSYAANNGQFQYPGPVLCVDEGDVVTITLRNELPTDTSVQFPGMEYVTADGHAAAPTFDVSGNLVSLTDSVTPGQSVTYSFTATNPGTFQYTSGTDPELQVQMGLVGVIVVRPDLVADVSDIDTNLLNDPTSVLHARLAYDDQTTRYSDAHEYLLLMSEIDPDLHLAVEQGAVLHSGDYAPAYKARYFLINGRSFPDVIAPNGAAWLPNQPYGGLAHVEPYDETGNPLPALIRYAGVGTASYPFHPHSNHERIIGRDGRLLTDDGTDLSTERFSIMVNPGATVDATFQWTNVEDYADTNGHELPLAYPATANMTDGDFWSGSPYLGGSGVVNPGVNSKNQCGEYYHVAHNHDLPKVSNYGAAFGGQLTLIRVEPPDPNNCGE
jgi:Multicopper oxidase